MILQKTSMQSLLTRTTHQTTSLPLTTLTFPEIRLETRDAHRLRGYFGDLFREHSPLLHNHFVDGSSRYAYPLVQYKVIRNEPILLGLGDGADLLAELFLKTKELHINGTVYPLFSKEIKHIQVNIGMTEHSIKYRFETSWMALNQHNHQIFRSSDQVSNSGLLENILTGNILSFFKAFKHFFDKDEVVQVRFNDVTFRSTKFKGNDMAAFYGIFTTNVLLPDLIGLGKSVSRGFGTIQRIA